ncbi:MAG: hypothetical protein J4N83_06245, partial [Chloroflexi bacterium]|nr:hypothetical protein [Chloroflexota bacterium]
ALMMLLNINGPLDLAQTLASGQAFRWRRHGQGFRGVVDNVLFTVRQASDGVAFESTPESEEAAAPRLRAYLRLDDDLPALYRRHDGDERLAAAFRAYPGLRLLRQDPWECLVCFVISIYSNIVRISGNVGELCRRYGEPLTPALPDAFTFPSPARLAEVGEAEFRDMGLGFRARFLSRLAGEVLELGMDLSALRGWDYPRAKAALLGLYGVGEKVADCVLAFSLDQPEAFPVDVWVRRAVQEWYFDGRNVTDRAVRLWAGEHFGRDAAYAQQYLFHQRRLQGRTAKVGATPSASSRR